MGQRGRTSVPSNSPAVEPAAPSESGDAPEETIASPRPRASLPLIILCVIAILAVMYVARDLLVPIVLALLLALILRPAMRRMRALHLPDIVSAFLLIAGVVAIFVLGMLSLAGQAQQWLAEAPATIQKVSSMLPTKTGPLSNIEKTTAAVQDLTKPEDAQEPMQVELKSTDLALAVLGVSTHFVGAAVIIFVVSFFVLAFSDTLLKQAVESRHSFGEKRNVVELLQNVESGISRYLVTITVINIGLGIATGLAMWALKIPNPILWGVMATILNYVPHVGAFLGMVVLFFVGSVTHQSIGYGAVAALTFASLTTIESYFITPMVLSKSLQLSPLAVILAILFWGWLWGVSGGLMAAPLLAVLKIVCDQFDSLKGLGTFLAGESQEKSAHESPPDGAGEPKFRREARIART